MSKASDLLQQRSAMLPAGLEVSSGGGTIFVRQSFKKASWLLIGLMLFAGLVVGLLLGYWPMRTS